MTPCEKPEEGEAYDDALEGLRVRLWDGRTGVIIGRACSCYNPYEIKVDVTGSIIGLSCISFDVINEPLISS